MVDKKTLDGVFENHKQRHEVKNALFMVNKSGHITHVNSHWKSILGHKEGETVGNHLLPFIHIDDAGRVLKTLERLLHRGKGSRRMHHRMKHSNGSWKNVVTKATALKDHNGKILGVMGVTREVHSKRAQTGIGILIIFIATILVSAITSGILIKTSSSLQSKAITASERSTVQVSTAIQTATLSATNGSDKTVEYFDHRVKVASGGEPVNLQQMSITLDTKNADTNLVYGNGTCERNESTGFFTNASSGTGKFTVEYLSQGTEWEDGFLQRGDLVKLCYESADPLSSAQGIRIRLIPVIGNIHDIETNAPEVISTTRVIFI